MIIKNRKYEYDFILIDKQGFAVSGFNRDYLEFLDLDDEAKPEFGMTLIECNENYIPDHLIKPKWSYENEVWEEGESPEERESRINLIREDKLKLFRRLVTEKCYSIASEEEQRNWMLYPEDYDKSEIEKLKNLIMEKRLIYREFKNKLEQIEDIDEIWKLQFPEI